MGRTYKVSKYHRANTINTAKMIRKSGHTLSIKALGNEDKAILTKILCDIQVYMEKHYEKMENRCIIGKSDGDDGEHYHLVCNYNEIYGFSVTHKLGEFVNGSMTESVHISCSLHSNQYYIVSKVFSLDGIKGLADHLRSGNIDEAMMSGWNYIRVAINDPSCYDKIVDFTDLQLQKFEKSSINNMKIKRAIKYPFKHGIEFLLVLAFVIFILMAIWL